MALSPLGHELWRLQYGRGHQLTVSGIAPFNQPDFARRLLAEMQLALLDQSLLNGRLQALSLHQRGDLRQVRRNDGSVLLNIAQAGQLAAGSQIQLTSADYQLQITTLQQDLL